VEGVPFFVLSQTGTSEQFPFEGTYLAGHPPPSS